MGKSPGLIARGTGGPGRHLGGLFHDLFIGCGGGRG